MDRNQQQNFRMRHRANLRSLVVAIAMFCIASSTAFSPPFQQSLQHTSTSIESSSSSTTTSTVTRRGPLAPPSRISWSLHAKSQQPAADFEYQELQIQMNAMKEQNVKPSQLEPAKRNELKGYVEEILSRRRNKQTVDSTVPLDVKLRSSLPGTKWRMAFTTQSLMAEALPKDATIMLTFASGSGSAATGSNKVDYGLDFFKTLGLKRLTAKSTYTVMDPQPNFPGVAFVQIIYEKIVTDVMGFSNVGIGMFGMLKGRSTYIQTVFFDNNLWIETGVDEANGETYYNVYARDYDDDDNWEK